jgi:uncharacterized protein (DUF302 family)
MAQEHVNTTTHPVERLAVRLGYSYAEAVRRFEELVPVVPAAQFQALDAWDAVVALAAERAPLGFMRYGTLDVRAFLAASGSSREAVEYLMGNHVIAERMFRHDPAAVLYAPLRVVIHADDSGDAVFVIDRPGALFASFGDARIAAVGRELDEKVAGVLRALGVEAPAVLGAPATT